MVLGILALLISMAMFIAFFGGAGFIALIICFFDILNMFGTKEEK